MAATGEVGGDILSFCTSCKMDLNHVIVAIQGDRVKKVECRTCKKVHAYRIPKGAKSPTASKGRVDKKAQQAVAVELEWKKIMDEKSSQPSISYTTKSKLNLGDKIDHPSFGEGVVEKMIYPNKVAVLFQSDIKVLVHNR